MATAFGFALALGSDSPVTPLDPWGGVRAAVQHRTETQRLEPTDAFNAHTSGGWRAARNDVNGVLEVGADATYAVWQCDDVVGGAGGALPFLGDGSTTPECIRTVVHGVTVYER